MTDAVGLDQAIRARLDAFDASMDTTGSLWGAEEMRAAIGAVLELHPQDAGFCYACAKDFSVAYGEPTATFEAWPCPTVRAIAEKLGVEVHGG